MNSPTLLSRNRLATGPLEASPLADGVQRGP
jgi:hypothetical protein